MGKGPEPGRRLAHDPSGKPSNHFIENSEEPRKGKDAGQSLKPKLVQDFLRRPLSFLGGPFHESLEVQGGMLARKEDILLADLFIPCTALILADLPIRIGTIKQRREVRDGDGGLSV